MLKSVNQWCFPVGTPLEDIFRVSEEAGYDAVELNLYAPGEVGITMDSTVSELEQIGKLAAQHNLQLKSLSTGLMGKTPLSHADADVRAQGRQVISRQLEIAELLGIDTALVVPGRVSEDTSYDDCYERSFAEVSKLVPEAEQRKVNIGIENVWNKFLLSPLEMRQYVDDLNSPFVGVYFDVGNILLYGFPQQWIRILGKRIVKVHVKDFKTAVGNGQGFVPLLAGNVPWKEVVEALREVGYTDTLTAEISPYESDPFQAVRDTANQLEAIIKL